ncbi:MAG: PqqD family protein [Gemmatimonadota bacterium]
MQGFRRMDGVWSRPLDDRAVLYSWDEGKAIVLNPTGAVLWDALKSPRTASELGDLLVDRFPGLPAERVRADVAAFLDRLLRESVLQ